MYLFYINNIYTYIAITLKWYTRMHWYWKISFQSVNQKGYWNRIDNFVFKLDGQRPDPINGIRVRVMGSSRGGIILGEGLLWSTMLLYFAHADGS